MTIARRLRVTENSWKIILTNRIWRRSSNRCNPCLNRCNRSSLWKIWPWSRRPKNQSVEISRQQCPTAQQTKTAANNRAMRASTTLTTPETSTCKLQSFAWREESCQVSTPAKATRILLFSSLPPTTHSLGKPSSKRLTSSLFSRSAGWVIRRWSWPRQRTTTTTVARSRRTRRRTRSHSSFQLWAHLLYN